MDTMSSVEYTVVRLFICSTCKTKQSKTIDANKTIYSTRDISDTQEYAIDGNAWVCYKVGLMGYLWGKCHCKCRWYVIVNMKYLKPDVHIITTYNMHANLD